MTWVTIDKLAVWAKKTAWILEMNPLIPFGKTYALVIVRRVRRPIQKKKAPR